MAFTSVFILVCYLLLAAGHTSTVSEFAQVTYFTTTPSECGQADILQDEKLMTTLNHVQQQLSKKNILVNIYFVASHQLPQATIK